MKFASPLVRGTLIKRYKRFLADVQLLDGTKVTAHCANSGSMLGVQDPGSPVWLSPNTNPKAKLPYRWELIEVGGALVGINTSHPNRIVEEAVLGGAIPELAGYDTARREVKYGRNSRIDLMLEGPGTCYVEVKNVTLKRGHEAQFPDAVTARGTKHLHELADMVAAGHRSVMVYLAQRADCDRFTIADDIDQAYAAALRTAVQGGVELLAYQCHMATDEIRVERPLPIHLADA